MTNNDTIFPALEKDEFLYGQRGVAQVRESLSRHNPAQVIAEAQQRFQVSDPQVRAGYPLADLLGVSRRTLHADCIAALTQLMVKKIENETMDYARFMELFNATFPQIKEPELRQVPMALCRKHPDWVPIEAYEDLSKGEVYEVCPLEMKRRLWLHDHNLFGQYILPTVKEYIEDPVMRAHAGEMRGTDLATSSKDRREHPSVKELMRLIGDNLQLYNVCLGLLRSLFIQDGQPLPCMLRFDLLMAMHDADVKQICDVDPCHKLVWSLDACIRTQQLDERRVEEMRRFFESVKHRSVNEGVYGDLGIVLYDPFASNMIAGQLLQHLHAYSSKLGKLSEMKSDRTLQWASVVLNLGVHALHMIRERDFQIPRVPKSVSPEFFSALVRVMAEDQRHSGRRWNDAERPAGIGPEMEKVMRENTIAQMVFAHYILERLQRGDFLALSHALPSFLAAIPTNLPPWPLLNQLSQSFVSLLLNHHLPTLTTQEHITRLVVDNFLLKCVNRTVIVHEQVLRLAQAILWRTEGPMARVAYQWVIHCGENGARQNDDKWFAFVQSNYYQPIVEKSQGTPWALTRDNAPGVFEILLRSNMDTTA